MLGQRVCVKTEKWHTCMLIVNVFAPSAASESTLGPEFPATSLKEQTTIGETTGPFESRSKLL